MMKRIWSPWRSRHLERVSKDPTLGRGVFAAIAEDTDDEKNLVLWRGTSVFVLMNLFPYNNGHLLIVPYRVVQEYEDLTEEERNEMAEATSLCVTWLKKILRPDGFNVGMNIGTAGGAGIPDHLHAHVVPRWEGDTNFMPVTGEVKVVPESVAETYRKLLAVIPGSP